MVLSLKQSAITVDKSHICPNHDGVFKVLRSYCNLIPDLLLELLSTIDICASLCRNVDAFIMQLLCIHETTGHNIEQPLLVFLPHLYKLLSLERHLRHDSGPYLDLVLFAHILFAAASRRLPSYDLLVPDANSPCRCAAYRMFSTNVLRVLCISQQYIYYTLLVWVHYISQTSEPRFCSQELSTELLFRAWGEQSLQSVSLQPNRSMPQESEITRGRMIENTETMQGAQHSHQLACSMSLHVASIADRWFSAQSFVLKPVELSYLQQHTNKLSTCTVLYLNLSTRLVFLP